MDIDLVLEILEKHGVTNEALAEDLVTLAIESYRDGAFEREYWWYDEAAYEEFVKEHEEKDDSDFLPGLPFDRNK